MPTEKHLNIHEKLLKIADMAGILQRTKEGHNYKYVPEEDIQAKVTAGMQKYGVDLLPSIREGTLKVTPYPYETIRKGERVPVYEVIVQCEVLYTWVNVENPSETIECNWAYIGQMADASQAFGAGATYGNRYYLMKALQLATTEQDPDNYRSKQQQTLDEADDKVLKGIIGTITNLGSTLISMGYAKEDVKKLLSAFKIKDDLPRNIPNEEVANKVLQVFTEKVEELTNKTNKKEK